MIGNKPINFKPTIIDQSLINAIQSHQKFDTTADLLRAAIQQLAIVSLDPDTYANAVLNGYEKEVLEK